MIVNCGSRPASIGNERSSDWQNEWIVCERSPSMRASCLRHASRYVLAVARAAPRTADVGDDAGHAMRSPSNCDSTSASASWMRSAISPAAFSVNVIRTMRSGDSSSFDSSSSSTSATIAVVFPVPAPASMTTLRRAAEHPHPSARSGRSAASAMSRGASKERAGLAAAEDEALRRVVARPAGVVHRTVLAGVVVVVPVIGERRKRAPQHGGDEEIERLTQSLLLFAEIEREVAGF